MKDFKNVIGIDFQGWPVCKMTLREILNSLGAETITTEDGHSYLAFEDTDSHLDAFPKILEDDGMGYGVNQRVVTEAGPDIYFDKESGENVFNVFVDKPRPEEIERFKKEQEEYKQRMNEKKD